MAKCIYYKSDSLSFNSREHVIPAGLGGKNTLPEGYVSDEVNNYFSALELKALRESIVGGIRNYLGPGKRGRKVIIKEDGLVTCRKEYNPHVQFLKRKSNAQGFDSDEYCFRLGFMYDKHTMLLPQILFLFDNHLALTAQIYSPGEFDNRLNNVGYCFDRVDAIEPENVIKIDNTNLYVLLYLSMVICFIHLKWRRTYLSI